MPLCPVHDFNGNKVDEIELPEIIFGGRINEKLLHQVILMYQANQRSGTASTKERADVSGGGKKPYRQKGTGQSRAGSSRSPLRKGGGVTFGPHPRDFSYKLPRQMKIAALKASLKARYVKNNFLCLDQIPCDTAKTKDFAKILKILKLQDKTLALVDTYSENLKRASRNIASIEMICVKDVTAYDVLRNKKILITRDALLNLLKRLEMQNG